MAYQWHTNTFWCVFTDDASCIQLLLHHHLRLIDARYVQYYSAGNTYTFNVYASGFFLTHFVGHNVTSRDSKVSEAQIKKPLNVVQPFLDQGQGDIGNTGGSR